MLSLHNTARMTQETGSLGPSLSGREAKQNAFPAAPASPWVFRDPELQSTLAGSQGSAKVNRLCPQNV